MVTIIAKSAISVLKGLMILGLVQWISPDLSYQIGYYTSQLSLGWLK